MFVLPTLVYTLLGATMALASPAPTRKSVDAAVPPTPDLGINCNGSGFCDWGKVGATSELVGYINQISDDAWYNNGQQIACTAGQICAFLQNTGGSNGQWIKMLAPYIPAHRCNVCGSVPYYYTRGDNDVSHGELTFNYVSDPCHKGSGGLC